VKGRIAAEDFLLADPDEARRQRQNRRLELDGHRITVVVAQRVGMKVVPVEKGIDSRRRHGPGEIVFIPSSGRSIRRFRSPTHCHWQKPTTQEPVTASPYIDSFSFNAPL